MTAVPRPIGRPTRARLAGNAPCPCGTGRKARGCCLPLLRGDPAATPEALMRSRYVAWSLGDAAYLMRTTATDSPHRTADARAWEADLRAAAAEVTFVALHVDEAPPPDDGWGVVAFRAEALRDGLPEVWAERSRFCQEGGRWVYVDGG